MDAIWATAKQGIRREHRKLRLGQKLQEVKDAGGVQILLQGGLNPELPLAWYEDLFRWTLREADASAATGKPFHYFVMTTSNHRPYTFPEGRIDLPAPLFEHARLHKFMREVFETVAYNKSSAAEAAARLIKEGNALLKRIQ